ncbi:MerR family transcriptional regulator [Kribbella sp. NBC_01245]|uniref:MerR family transcriptional regulator n=1 Tax=Kribbella sp. NBC_01245 TaxID=2903578 RepID=UPI002E29EB7A|nr:MerR family transcriptional regulator [Kribbella sp. NBC_01245]
MKSTDLTIGDLAARFGLATHVLRHWESEGLLTPSRRVGNQRRYDAAAVDRVAVILRAKKAGLSLDRMRRVLTGGLAERRTVLKTQYDDLVAQIAEAQAALAMLDHALACRADPLESCPHFRQLAQAPAT